jgi:fibronectin-binding autotransporter adhesin
VIKSSGNRKTSKTSRNILRAAVMASPALLFMGTAQAVPYYWDINNATGGASGGTTAAGTWDAGTANWTTDSAGASSTVVWAGGANVAAFAAGTNATGAYTVAVSGTQQANGLLFEEGTVTLSGGTINLTSPTPSISHASGATRTISSTLTGTNGLLFTSTANTFAAPTVLSGNNSGLTGVVTLNNLTTTASTTSTVRIIIGHNNALGASGVGNELKFTTGAADGSTYVRVELPGGFNVNKDATIVSGANFQGGFGNIWNTGGVNTWSGNIDVLSRAAGSGANLAGIGGSSGTLVVTGVIGSTGTSSTLQTWGKNGAAKLVLANTNTFGSVGGSFFRIGNGDVEVRANGAFGTAGSKTSITDKNTLLNPYSTNSAPGVTFANNVNYTTFEMINVPATQTNSPATTPFVGCYVDSINGANTFAGDIRLGDINTGVGFIVRATGTSSLDLSGHIWGGTTTGAARMLTKQGTGELILSGDNSTVDTLVYTLAGFVVPITTGTFDITGGKLTMRGAGTMGAGGNMGFIGQVGTTITLDNTTTAVSNRIGDTAPVTLKAAELALIGNATNGVTELLGAVSVQGGSKISITPAGQHSELSPSSLTRTVGGYGTLLVRGLDGVNGVMNASGATVLVGQTTGAGNQDLKILPWGVADASPTGGGADFITIGDGNGTGAIRSLTSGEYGTLAEGATTFQNVHVSSSPSAFTTPNSIAQLNALKISGTNTTINTGPGFIDLQSGALLATGAGEVINGKLRFGMYTIFEDVEAIGDPQAEGIIHVSSGADLTINADIKGELGIVKAGDGVLKLTNTANSYAGQTVINGGILAVTVDALGVATNPVILNGGILRGAASTSLVASRPVQLTSSISNTIDVPASTNFSIAGNVTGAGVLTKTGAGSLVLTNAANNYAGTTDISGGDIVVSASGQLSNTQVRLQGGAVHAKSNVTMTNTMAVNSGAAGVLVDPTFKLIWSGVLTGSSPLVIDGGGTFNPTGNNGHSGGHLVKGGSTLQYTVSQGNGNDPGVGVPYFELDNGTVQTVGQTVNSTGTNGVGSFSAGKAIKLDAGGGTFDIQQGVTASPNTVTILGNITGAGSLTKKGLATRLLITGSAGYTGNTNVNEGILEINGDLKTPAAGVTVANGQRFVMTAGGNRMLHVNTLNLNSSGTADLNDQDLVVESGTFAALQGLIFQGYRGGPDTTADGIISSTSQAGSVSPPVPGGATILALFDNSMAGFTEFPGGTEPIGANAMVAKYTYIGDTNYDGQVTPQDYTATDSNLGTSVDPAISWFYGDTNFDGNIDPSDYAGIDGALGLGVGNPLSAQGLASVPEPTSLGLMGVAGAGMLMRRRRSK